MKWFKIFESDKFSSLKEEIGDIFEEIKDTGLNFKFGEHPDAVTRSMMKKKVDPEEFYIFIAYDNKVKPYGTKFPMSQLKDNLIRLNSYIEMSNIRFAYALYESDDDKKIPNSKSTVYKEGGKTPTRVINAMKDIIAANKSTSIKYIKIVFKPK